MTAPLLSICIPSYNRADLVTSLVERLLTYPGRFEICVHVDGATDDTLARLNAIKDTRLHVSTGLNTGRAGALVAALAQASGRYCMVFDDDDTLFPKGLARVLTDCAKPLPHRCVGRIYHMQDAKGQRIGTTFPVTRSNLIALRADHGVTGDKKEIVLTAALRAAMQTDGAHRRVPTSLYWARLALTADVLCVNAEIGAKSYLAGGMTDRIAQLKRSNPAPLILLHQTRLSAFAKRRFRSWRYALRSALALGVYRLQALRSGS